jgi:DNA-binding HxlR family transcriptional regulator
VPESQKLDAVPVEVEVEAADPLFDPVARALDLLGERWTLVVVRHLLGGPRGFQLLRARTGIAPRVLSTRLRQLTERGFVEQVQVGPRQQYALTPRGLRLEPIVREIARWWVLNEMDDTGPYRDTSAASVVESLPFMLREERARGERRTYELRLEGDGGGVWTIEIDDGVCRVDKGFAARADIRYTMDARDWCRLALGHTTEQAARREGRLKQDGDGKSLGWFFHQPASRSQPGPRKGESA